MSVQETKDDIEDDAYQVVEATNKDGTIDAEVVEKPYRDEDELVIKARPLVPDADEEHFRLEWPSRNTSEFRAVRLAKREVGGFQAIGQMKNERIKLDQVGDGWNLVVPDQDIGRLDSVRSYLSGAYPSVETIAGILFLIALIGTLLPLLLALLLPFGVSVLSVWQGVSVFIGSFSVMMAAASVLGDAEDG